MMLVLNVGDDGVYDMEYTLDRNDVPTVLREIADQMDAGAAIDTDEDDNLV